MKTRMPKQKNVKLFRVFCFKFFAVSVEIFYEKREYAFRAIIQERNVNQMVPIN